MSPNFRSDLGVSPSNPADSAPNTFAALLDQVSKDTGVSQKEKDTGVSQEEAGATIDDLIAWMMSPPPSPIVESQPAAPGVFGPDETA